MRTDRPFTWRVCPAQGRERLCVLTLLILTREKSWCNREMNGHFFFFIAQQFEKHRINEHALSKSKDGRYWDSKLVSAIVVSGSGEIRIETSEYPYRSFLSRMTHGF